MAGRREAVHHHAVMKPEATGRMTTKNSGSQYGVIGPTAYHPSAPIQVDHLGTVTKVHTFYERLLQGPCSSSAIKDG